MLGPHTSKILRTISPTRIQHSTNYKRNKDSLTGNNASLAEERHCFFAQFDTEVLDNVATSPPATTNYILTMDVLTALTQHKQKGHVKAFLDYSFAFNTIIPSKFATKPLDLGFSNSLCMWIEDFFLNCLQTIRLRPQPSPSLTLTRPDLK